MYKNPLTRAVLCLVLILLANIIISGGLDKINVSLTNYLNAVENEVTVNDSLERMAAINDIKLLVIEDNLKLNRKICNALQIEGENVSIEILFTRPSILKTFLI
jgi:hypothetical protein